MMLAHVKGFVKSKQKFFQFLRKLSKRRKMLCGSAQKHYYMQDVWQI